MKRPTAQHGGARMKYNGDSLSLPLSLSLIHAYMCLTVSRRPLSRDRSVTFFKKISNCLKRPKNVVWQSADGRVTSDHCHVTVQWLFSKNYQIAWNVQKTLFDSRPTVAWPPTTVAWPFSDFFQKNFKLLETSKKRCLTVGRRSRDLRPLSRDRSVTFFKKLSNCLKRPKNVVWQSADGRVTSDHCRVTFSDFFQNFSELLDTSKNVVWQSYNGRVTSGHCRVTFSDFFQKFSESLETSKKRCLTVIQRSRDLRPRSRDLQWLFSNNFPNRLKRLKTLFDSHPTVAWPPTTVAWPSVIFFQNFPELLETSKKRCLTVIQRSRDLRPLSRDIQWLFSKNFRIAWNV